MSLTNVFIKGQINKSVRFLITHSICLLFSYIQWLFGSVISIRQKYIPKTFNDKQIIKFKKNAKLTNK